MTLLGIPAHAGLRLLRPAIPRDAAQHRDALRLVRSGLGRLRNTDGAAAGFLVVPAHRARAVLGTAAGAGADQFASRLCRSTG
jgi:hypothetical protein